MGYMVGKVCVAAVVLVIMAASRSTAQPPLPTGCMAELMPCMVNITATTMFCCTPLNDVLKNQLPCLCAVLNDPAGQLNLKTALDLFAGCNITGVSSNLCSAAPASSPSDLTPDGASSPPPPPPPTNTNLAPPPKDKNTAQKTTWIGVSTFFSLLLI